MGRWKPDAQGRLQRAAMELYAERGFDNTTVEEIAARAGLTKRTFFRYFADKREVLFSGSEQLEELITGAVAGAPADAPPLDAVGHGLAAAGELFDERRAFAVERQRTIAANPELQERELIKLASLAAAIAAALARRGVGEPAATLAADAGVAVFRVAFEEWVQGPDGVNFAALVDRSLHDLRVATAA